MKHTILLLALGVSLSVKGQVTLRDFDNISSEIYKGGDIKMSYKEDTVKCVMVLIDTSASYVYFGNGEPHTILNREVKWDYGYFIKGTYKTQYVGRYLDINKQSLSENIIVWLSKIL